MCTDYGMYARARGVDKSVKKKKNSAPYNAHNKNCIEIESKKKLVFAPKICTYLVYAH